MISNAIFNLTLFVKSTSQLLSSCVIQLVYFPLAGIKKYIVGLIIKTSSSSESLERERMYLNKLNMILVQVRVMSDETLLHILTVRVYVSQNLTLVKSSLKGMFEYP